MPMAASIRSTRALRSTTAHDTPLRIHHRTRHAAEPLRGARRSRHRPRQDRRRVSRRAAIGAWSRSAGKVQGALSRSRLRHLVDFERLPLSTRAHARAYSGLISNRRIVVGAVVVPRPTAARRCGMSMPMAGDGPLTPCRFYHCGAADFRDGAESRHCL